jgi:hypothetical protein
MEFVILLKMTGYFKSENMKLRLSLKIWNNTPFKYIKNAHQFLVYRTMRPSLVVAPADPFKSSLTRVVCNSRCHMFHLTLNPALTTYKSKPTSKILIICLACSLTPPLDTITNRLPGTAHPNLRSGSPLTPPSPHKHKQAVTHIKISHLRAAWSESFGCRPELLV